MTKDFLVDKNCNNHNSKNPNGISKSDLVKLSVKKGMKISDANKHKKEDLCKFLGIKLENIPKNKSISNTVIVSEHLNCKLKNSKNPNGILLKELKELAIEKGYNEEAYTLYNLISQNNLFGDYAKKLNSY